MSYYIATILKGTFEDAVASVTDELKKEGFGVLTDIDMKTTMKKKLDEDFRNYRILGACNPPFAFKALQKEDKIGTMLPCNIIVQEKESGEIEIAAVDPVSSMQAVDNAELEPIAGEIRDRLQRVVGALSSKGRE